MSEGDVIHARVLSVGDGTASLRTSDGALLCARLENGVILSPGADVYLSVKDSGSEITVLSPVNPELAMTGVRRADPLLEAVFNQLVSLGYEPTAENMSAMRQLLAEIPDMPLREAAFFAAQGLDPEPALLDAFRAVASGEADTASFLDKLSVAVSTPAESAETPAAPDMNAPAVPGVFADSEMPAAIAPQAPLTAEKSEAENTAPATRSAPEPENTAAQEGADAARANTVRPEADMTLPEFGRWILEALGAGAPKTGGTESAPVLTGETLAESPLLGGLSERGFAEIAEILNRIAVEMPKTGGESELFENISKLVKELFVRPDGDGAELRGRLKEIREDLYIKLSYFRDAAANSPAQSKGAVLEQTQKLMDHLRLLNGLDQFVFVQIPIRLGDERRNADLYIYKREK
ncbi:MAG: hypothetical protein GX823_06765, partial [Clostridiales bacterium]|nr:hypothetical protein [Clostridiales bacterium]